MPQVTNNNVRDIAVVCVNQMLGEVSWGMILASLPKQDHIY